MVESYLTHNTTNRDKNHMMVSHARHTAMCNYPRSGDVAEIGWTEGGIDRGPIGETHEPLRHGGGIGGCFGHILILYKMRCTW